MASRPGNGFPYSVKAAPTSPPPVKSPPSGFKSPPPAAAAKAKQCTMKAIPKEPPAGSRVLGLVSMPQRAKPQPPPAKGSQADLQPASKRAPPLPAESTGAEPNPTKASSPSKMVSFARTAETQPAKLPPASVREQREAEPKPSSPKAESSQGEPSKPPPPPRTQWRRAKPEPAQPLPPPAKALAESRSPPPPPPKQSSSPVTAQLAQVVEELSWADVHELPSWAELETPSESRAKAQSYKAPPPGLGGTPENPPVLSSSSTMPHPSVPKAPPEGFELPPLGDPRLEELSPQLVATTGANSPQLNLPGGVLNSPHPVPVCSPYEHPASSEPTGLAYGPIRTDSTHVSPDRGIDAAPGRPGGTQHFSIDGEPLARPDHPMPPVLAGPPNSLNPIQTEQRLARSRSSSPELVPADDYRGVSHCTLDHSGSCEGRGRRWAVHGKYWRDGFLRKADCPCCSVPRACAKCLILQDECTAAATKLASSQKFNEEAFYHWNVRCDERLLKYFAECQDILPNPANIELAAHYKNDLTDKAQPGTVVFCAEAPHLAQWQYNKGWDWVQSTACPDFWLLTRPGSFPLIRDMSPEELVYGWPPDMSAEEKNGWILCNHVDQTSPSRGPIFFDMSCGDNLFLPSPPRGTAWKAVRRQRYHLLPKTFVDQVQEPFAYLYKGKPALTDRVSSNDRVIFQ